MAATGFLPVYRESDWSAVPEVIHDTIKNILFYLHSSKTKLMDTEIRLEVGISQSQQAEERLNKGTQELQMMHEKVQEQISELNALSKKTELMIEQQRAEFNKLKEQLEILHRVDQLTIEHNASINDLTKKSTQTDEHIDQFKKTMSTINNRVRGLNDSVLDLTDKDRDRRMELDSYRDGFSSDIRSMKMLWENNVDDIRSRFGLVNKEIEILRYEKDHLIEALKNPTEGLSKAISDRIEYQSRQIIDVLKRDIEDKMELFTEQADQMQDMMSSRISEFDTNMDNLSKSVEDTDASLKILIESKCKELRKMISDEESSRHKNEQSISTKFKQVDSDFMTVEMQFTEVRKRFGLVENRMQQADSFIGDSIRQIEDIMMKEFQRLENNLIQRMSNLPITKVLEARLYSIETRLRLEETDRMFNELSINQEIEEIVQTVTRRPRTSAMSSRISEGDMISFMSDRSSKTTPEPTRVYHSDAGEEDPTASEQRQFPVVISPPVSARRTHLYPKTPPSGRRPMLVSKPPSTLPNPSETPRKVTFSPRNTNS